MYIINYLKIFFWIYVLTTCEGRIRRKNKSTGSQNGESASGKISQIQNQQPVANYEDYSSEYDYFDEYDEHCKLHKTIFLQFVFIFNHLFNFYNYLIIEMKQK